MFASHNGVGFSLCDGISWGHPITALSRRLSIQCLGSSVEWQSPRACIKRSLPTQIADMISPTLKL